MPPLTPSSWLTAWQASPFGIAVTVILLVAYCFVWARARRRGSRVGVGRLALFTAVGVGILAYALCGPVGVYSHTFLWVFGMQVALLTAVVPLGFALGRPLDVVCAAAGSEAPRRVLAGRVARLLMYPLVSTVLATVSVLLVFVTGYGQAAMESSGVFAVLVVHLLLVGMLVVLPLLADDLLPKWAGPGVRTLIAAADGLVDAVPGIVLMTRSRLMMPRFPGFAAAHAQTRGGLSPLLDQRYTGGALLAVTEAIGLPLIIAVFVDWMRADAESAREVDARLDAAQGQEASTPWWLHDDSL